MRDEPVLAVVGATGLVGREMLAVLTERKFPYSELRLFASENSEGVSCEVDGEEVSVSALEEDSFEGVDIVLFATNSQVSGLWAPIAADAGAIVVDNSSHFRMHDSVPLVVPEVNREQITPKSTIIASPNCCAAPLTMVLSPFQKAVGIKRVVVSTYQSVSGAGKAAMDELWNQSLAIFNQGEIEMSAFPHQISFNSIPHIDTILEDGTTKEEQKIISETRKILALPTLAMSVTSVRVPVFHSHAESVNVECASQISTKDLVDVLQNQVGLEVFAAHDEYPMQITASGGDAVQVGRIRKDESVPCGFNLWIVSDNLRKGAALNAVQIAELLLNSK